MSLFETSRKKADWEVFMVGPIGTFLNHRLASHPYITYVRPHPHGGGDITPNRRGKASSVLVYTCVGPL